VDEKRRFRKVRSPVAKTLAIHSAFQMSVKSANRRLIANRQAVGRRVRSDIREYRYVWSAAELQAKPRMTVRSASMYSAFGGVRDSWP
jgi:hypothetical protein